MRWKEFEKKASGISRAMQEQMDRYRIVLVGTTRADGSARISPVNPYVVGGDLLLGMMPGSRKAADLARDPRCVVHSAVSDHTGKEGEVKLYGRVVECDDADRRAAYLDAAEAEFGFRPPEPFPLWALDIRSACQISYEEADGHQHVVRWPR